MRQMSIVAGGVTLILGQGLFEEALEEYPTAEYPTPNFQVFKNVQLFM